MQLQKFCISLKRSNVFGTYYWTRFPAARLMLLDLATASDSPLFLFFLNCVSQFLTHGITGVYWTICFWEDISRVCLILFENENCLLKFCKTESCIKQVMNHFLLFLWIGIGYKQYCCNFIFFTYKHCLPLCVISLRKKLPTCSS